MQAEYKRELNHSYMYVETDREQIRRYTSKMLLRNSIKGLLPCNLRCVDGKEFFYYEITSRQSLMSLYEGRKFGWKDLQKLFMAVADIMDGLEEYLLEGDGLVLEPGCIYQDMEEDSFQFCYFPGKKEDFQQEICRLAEYVLPKIDHQDAEAVVLGYGVYKESVEGSPGSGQLRVLAEKDVKKQEGKKYKEREKETENTGWTRERAAEERERALDAFFMEEDEAEEKNPYIWLAGVIFTLAAVFTILFIMLHFRLATLLQIGVGILISFMAAGAGVFLHIMRKKMDKKKEKTEEEGWKEEDKEEVEGYAAEDTAEDKEDEKESPCGPTALLTPKSSRISGRILKLKKDGEAKIWKLEKEISVIGKMVQASDICLDYPGVSRIHGKIRRWDGKDFLSDLNSRNGTRLNGQILVPEREYLLQKGDIITIADVELEYCMEE